MTQADWDICSGAVAWLRRRSVDQWIKDTGPACEFDAGPLMDAQGVPVKRRGCGCDGRPPVIALKDCTHPQMVASRTPGQEGCESRCVFFKAKVNESSPAT